MALYAVHMQEQSPRYHYPVGKPNPPATAPVSTGIYNVFDPQRSSGPTPTHPGMYDASQMQSDFSYPYGSRTYVTAIQSDMYSTPDSMRRYSTSSDDQHVSQVSKSRVQAAGERDAKPDHEQDDPQRPLSRIRAPSMPGPIPATKPLVEKRANGVQWISFQYSRERIKSDHHVRCDIETVDQERLMHDFKQANCVYPRAYAAAHGKLVYNGNRLNYETDCNTVGWALAELNPELRGKRGLIQRAVDSWRNCSSDRSTRSRRVRRMDKAEVKKHQEELQDKKARCRKASNSTSSTASSALTAIQCSLPPDHVSMFSPASSFDDGDVAWGTHYSLAPYTSTSQLPVNAWSVPMSTNFHYPDAMRPVGGVFDVDSTDTMAPCNTQNSSLSQKQT